MQNVKNIFKQVVNFRRLSPSKWTERECSCKNV